MLDPRDHYGDPDFVLGGLSIWALSRQFPDSEDFDDGNWLYSYARAEAPGARIDISGPWLRADEIESFLDELRPLNADLKGAAALDCMECALKVEVRCGSLGALEVTVNITPDLATQSHRMVYSLDQTYLSAAIDGCAAILANYPVRRDRSAPLVGKRAAAPEKFYLRLWRMCSKLVKNARFP
jgi:hypothetical protein